MIIITIIKYKRHRHILFPENNLCYFSSSLKLNVASKRLINYIIVSILSKYRSSLLLLILLTFIKEAVNSVDGGTLMVTPEEEEVLWVLDLVC